MKDVKEVKTSWANARVKLHSQVHIEFCSDLTCRDLTCPDLTCPDLTCSDLTVPDFTLPDLTLPDLTLPDLTLPELTCPSLTCSDLTLDHTCAYRISPSGTDICSEGDYLLRI